MFTVAELVFSQPQYSFTEQSPPFEVCINSSNGVSIEVHLALNVQTEVLTATSSDFLGINRDITINGSTCVGVDILADNFLEETEMFRISLESLDPRLVVSGTTQTIIDIIDNNCK